LTLKSPDLDLVNYTEQRMCILHEYGSTSHRGARDICLNVYSGEEYLMGVHGKMHSSLCVEQMPTSAPGAWRVAVIRDIPAAVYPRDASRNAFPRI